MNLQDKINEAFLHIRGTNAVRYVTTKGRIRKERPSKSEKLHATVLYKDGKMVVDLNKKHEEKKIETKKPTTEPIKPDKKITTGKPKDT